MLQENRGSEDTQATSDVDEMKPPEPPPTRYPEPSDRIESTEQTLLHSAPPTLLRLLSDGQHHSGEVLASTLKMTRSAIWKQIQLLRKKGISIEAIQGKGYRIQGGLDLYCRSSIEPYLNTNTKTVLDDLILLDSIDSTNAYLLSKVDTASPRILACFTEFQTQGRGRRGREWLSPMANNIYHSLLWYFKKDPSELMGLSLAVAVMVVRALNEYGISEGLELKWPNDILYQGQKLAGILIEMVAQPHDISATVLGIGLNTRLSPALKKTLSRPVSSIEEITRRTANRNQLAGLLLNALIHGLSEFCEHGLSAFLSEWRALDPTPGKMVRLEFGHQSVVGIAEAISNRGELLLKQNGQITAYLSGEMSLRDI